MPPIVISLEGNIGSGKTTLFNQLWTRFASYDNVTFLQEPINEWNEVTDKDGVTILEKYYGNQQKYAFSFQMMAFTSRLAALRAALKKPGCDIIISERSLCTDKEVFAKMLYDDGKLEEVEYSIYQKCFNEFIGEQPPIYYVYLKTDPLVSFERIKRRLRPGEIIPLPYLTNCDLYHDNWLQNQKNDRLLILDANADLRFLPEVVHDWLSQVEKFIFYCERRI